MKSFFSIFSRTHNSFGGEENNERVILLLRRHPFFILARLSIFVLLLLLPIVVGKIFANFLTENDLFSVFLFISSIWYLLVWSGIFYALTMYTLDVWIVTDMRIIDSTQRGFFDRTTSELHISRIQDISVQTRGVVQTFLDFGDLQVQTAGAEEKFKFSQIPNPVKVKDEIMKLASHTTPHHP